MIEIIQYIIGFLLGDGVSPETVTQVGYTADSKSFHKYKLVILPSQFFDNEVYGTTNSIPKLPLQIFDEVPILFGTAKSELINGTVILHADLIASTYYLVSRYEEMIFTDIKDQHGRFPGTQSLPYKAGFIDSPIVEEYGNLLRSYLDSVGVEFPEHQPGIKKIYLTHDVDKLSHYRPIRGLVGGLLRGFKHHKEGKRALKSFFLSITYDPWYTFPWLFDMDNSLKNKIGAYRCENIAFVRAGGGRRVEDRPLYMYNTPDFYMFKRLCRKKGITFGLHASYEAGIYPHRLFDEKKNMDKIAKRRVFYNRHHYLNSRHPQDMLSLIEAGITDDFTMGYADVAGFRLGTCKPVRWINPLSQRLTDLVLHPLTVMDNTLSDKKYMYFNAHDAYEYCVRLIDMVEKWNGELVLLWHNTSVSKNPTSYHRELYKKIIRYLSKK